MIVFKPMEPWHVGAFELPREQKGVWGLMDPQRDEAYGRQLIANGPCWAGIDDASGAVLGVAGFNVAFVTHAMAWAMFGPCLADHLRHVVRFVRERITTERFPRLEAVTKMDVPDQSRFAISCGFHRCHVLQNWGPACQQMVLHEVIDGKLWEKPDGKYTGL